MSCSARPTKRAFARFIAYAALSVGLVVVSFAVSPTALAQEVPSWAAPRMLDAPGDGPDDSGPPDPPPDPVPVGGGLGLLALVGGAYAARMLLRHDSDHP